MVGHHVKQGYTLCGRKAPMWDTKTLGPWHKPLCGECVDQKETLPWWRRH